MKKEFYTIFSVDEEQKLYFIEKNTKDDTLLKTKTYEEWLKYAEDSGYEVVDITLWEYENYEDKCLKVQNYQKTIKRR